MHIFFIKLNSVEDVKSFVRIATVQPFEVYVGTSSQTVSAKSFMGMFSLNFQEPLQVRIQCDEASYVSFLREAAVYIAA